MFQENHDGGLVNQQTPLPPDFLGLPNLLPNTGNYRQHRRSRSGIEFRHQPDLTSDIDLVSSQVWHIIYCWLILMEREK